MKQLLPLLLLLFCSLSLSAQWQYLPGPDGGFVFNLERDGDTLYALTQTGIYRSEDQGYHWKFMPGSRMAGITIERLTVENGVFYGINTYRKLMRSSDGGQSWQAILQEPFPAQKPGEYLADLYVKGDTVLVNSTFTIYRSVDRGENWTPTHDLYGFNPLGTFSTGSDFFSWSSSDIYRSSDRGLSWDRIFSFSKEFTVMGAVGNTQFILYNNMTRLARSTDGFRTWKDIETNVFLPVFGTFHYVLKLVGKGDTLYCMGKTSSSGCASRFCYSTDNGDTWHAGNNGKAVSITIDDVILFDRHLVFSNRQTGISHSTDGCQTFTTEQSGLTSTFVSGVATLGKTVFAAGNETVYVSNNDGQDWEETAPNIETAPCDKYCRMFSTQKRLYLIQKYGVKLYSEDEGVSWKPLDLQSFYPTGTTQNCLWASDYQSIHRISDDGSISTIDLKNHLDGQGINALVTATNHVIAITTGPYLILNETGQLLRKIPPRPANQCFSSAPKKYTSTAATCFTFV